MNEKEVNKNPEEHKPMLPPSMFSDENASEIWNIYRENTNTFLGTAIASNEDDALNFALAHYATEEYSVTVKRSDLDKEGTDDDN